MKKYSAIMAVAFLATIGNLNAQVNNYALSFSSEGYVDCGQMPALNNLSSYSIQFWLNPSSWKEGSILMSRGDDFTVRLESNENIIFSVGSSVLTVSDGDLKSDEWNQITLICNDGDSKAYVNGKEVTSGKLNAIPLNDSRFIIGGEYQGMLDEIRIWGDALNDEMKIFDYFINNTINKWCPMWDSLIAYYKMDQENCLNLVEYKVLDNPTAQYNNHGILSEGVRKVPANNDKMPYLINSAYTNNDRFFDRIIPKDQYLLSNELIILGVNTFASDGHLETKTPNNHAIDLNGTVYLDNFEGRDGVLSFDGKDGTRLTAPTGTLPPSNAYTFESWIYLDEWTPGAYLLRKENDNKSKGLAIYLGDDPENQTIVVRVDGKRISSKKLSIPLKKWSHVGVTAANGGSKTFAFSFFVDGTSYNGDPGNSDDSSNVVPSENESLPLYIGEGLIGKIDETCIWNKTWSVTDEKDHMTYIPLPALNRNVKVADMDFVGAYYRFDNPDNLGHSSHSQDEWLNIMKGAYDGHAGVKFFISVQGTYSPSELYGDWRNILGDADKRARFVSDLVKISENYDGVELDLEWIENNNQWTNYGVLAEEIRAALPEDKEFRISLHNSYTGFPVAKASFVDGFTFQQYGPQAQHFGYQNFENNVRNFINKFDKNKIMTSYSTTTSKGNNGSAVIGVKGDCLASYVPGDQNVDTYTTSNDTWSYMGPMQVYKRAKYTREENLQGIFYWDMGNDNWEGTVANPIMPKYNMAKYCSFGINANNDVIVNEVKIMHYGSDSSVNEIMEDKNKNILKVFPSPAEHDIIISLSDGSIPEKVSIFSITGSVMLELYKTGKIDVSSFSKGVYALKVSDKQGNIFDAKFIKK